MSNSAPSFVLSPLSPPFTVHYWKPQQHVSSSCIRCLREHRKLTHFIRIPTRSYQRCYNAYSAFPVVIDILHWNQAPFRDFLEFWKAWRWSPLDRSREGRRNRRLGKVSFNQDLTGAPVTDSPPDHAQMDGQVLPSRFRIPSIIVGSSHTSTA